MQVGSWKFTLGTKQLKLGNMNLTAREMPLPGNKKKVRCYPEGKKEKIIYGYRNVMHNLKIIWHAQNKDKLAHTNTEQVCWNTARSWRVDRIGLTSAFLQVTPLSYVHIWTKTSSERITLCISEITILLQSTGQWPFLSKDPELLWQENLTDYYYKA